MAIEYTTLRERHVQTLLERFPAMVDRLTWPADRLAAFREQQLRQLVAHAMTASSFHRERLGHLDPATMTEADLADVPAMTKADVTARFDDIVTDPRVTREAAEDHLAALDSGDAYLFERYHVVATGGSSGTRTIVVWDWDGWADCFLTLGRRGIVQQGPPDHARVMASVTAGHASHMTAALLQGFSSSLANVISVPATLPLPRIVERLNDIQPQTLQGYPSMLHQLALEAQHGRLRIAPEIVLCGSETLTRATRTLLAETWSASVQNGYGASEAGGIATDCGQGEGWLHLSDDVLVVEVEDDRLLVTNLMNRVMPLIRYELDDRVTLVDVDCPCGSAHRSIGEIGGRASEQFSFGGRVVHPVVISSALGAHRAVAEYQVRQHDHCLAIDVVQDGALDHEALRAGVERALAAGGAPGVVVRLRAVDEIPRSAATGKVRRFLPSP